MSLIDPNLQQEMPWLIKLCSGPKGRVLTKEESYELIRLARPSIKAHKILSSKKYKSALSRRPVLKESLLEIAARGEKARVKLVEHNYRLIISVAKKLQGRGLTWEDMIQHGVDGLLYAISKFDISSGNKLSTYATQWIRQRIGRAIENTGRIIRIPIHKQATINEIKYIYRKYVEIYQMNPTSEELAALYNKNPRNKKKFKPITKEEAEELGRYLHEVSSLDETAGEDENLSVLDYIGDETPSPEDLTEKKQDKEYLFNILTLLVEASSQAFMKFKYGLLDETPKSDAKTAEAFHMTTKEVREEEGRILLQLNKLANKAKTNLDFSTEVFSLILLHAYEEYVPGIQEALNTNIARVPCKIYESEDKDQMLILAARVRALGGRVEIISNFS